MLQVVCVRSRGVKSLVLRFLVTEAKSKIICDKCDKSNSVAIYGRDEKVRVVTWRGTRAKTRILSYACLPPYSYPAIHTSQVRKTDKWYVLYK